MGRRRTLPESKNLPARMHKKGRTYWHVSTATPRKWTKLGTDYPLALRLYGELEGEEQPGAQITFAHVAKHYRRRIFPTKAPATQRNNELELRNLEKVFGPHPIDSIKPRHVQRYIDERALEAPVRANREKALLSHVWNYARSAGFTDLANPCQGIRGTPETGRDRYVTDEEFLAVWHCAHPTVQDAMDLAYRTGQRPGDVLRMQQADVRDGVLHVAQGKTGKKLRIQIEGELARAIERMENRPRRTVGRWLVQDEAGQPLTAFALRSRFGKALRTAGVSFQFRDLRAKAATDKADEADLRRTQKLLGHESEAMTEHYSNRRQGELVQPVGRCLNRPD